MIRVGQGFDAHRFGAQRRLILAGVEVPHETGLIAHSDGDVVIHALCDALLGAAGLGDIGQHFPDSDAAFKNADSRALLKTVLSLLQQRQWRVINVDLTVIAQVPKISPFREVMRERLALDLAIDVGCVNVKATTTEQMGFTGRGEGIAALAVCLLTSEAPSNPSSATRDMFSLDL